MYDRDAYDALRRKYGADEAFYNIYQKVSARATGVCLVANLGVMANLTRPTSPPFPDCTNMIKVSLTDEERAVLQTPLGRSEKAHLALVIAKIIGHKIGTWFK